MAVKFQKHFVHPLSKAWCFDLLQRGGAQLLKLGVVICYD